MSVTRLRKRAKRISITPLLKYEIVEEFEGLNVSIISEEENTTAEKIEETKVHRLFNNPWVVSIATGIVLIYFFS